MTDYDAVIVGSGPNGLAAAAHLTRAGRRVLVIEGDDEIGGGARTSELTLPGFLHDVCSAIHPLGAASPFFQDAELTAHGLEWIHPDIPVTHPLDGGRVGVIHSDLGATVDALGADGGTYRRLVGAMVPKAATIIDEVLGPVPLPPRHPLTLGRYGALGALPASRLVSRFETDEARAVIAGLAAHSIAPLTQPFTAAVAVLFAIVAHSYGWPLARHGSRSITDALAEIVTTGGGEIQTGLMVRTLGDLPPRQAALLDVMPPAALSIAADRVGRRPRRRATSWANGPGVFKLDWALSDPIPWADQASRRAGTVHVGGTYAEVAASEAQVADGDHPAKPFVIVAQQSLFDSTRAPAGNHTAWGYCHVPAGSSVDMTDAIESQIERFAPGFRDTILGRHAMGPGQFVAHNPNYVGGDIAGGAFRLRKVFQLGRRSPYTLGDGLFLCGSSTPPGAGVHGMCGFYAAEAVLARS